MIGGPAGNNVAARARSSAEVQATGNGGGLMFRTAASWAILWPGRRRITARRRVGTIQAIVEPRISTTKSHSVVTAPAHSGSQCSLNGSLSTTMVRSRLGMRANTPSATGPQATVMRASEYVRIRWSSRPVDSTASPRRLEVMNRMRIAPTA